MNHDEEAAEQLLFSQVSYHIANFQHTPADVLGWVSIADQEQDFKIDMNQLNSALKSNGADDCGQRALAELIASNGVTHIISTTSDFPEYDAATEALIPVIKPEWVTASIAKGRLANPRSYSPDPRLFFSGLVLCCADIPEGDKDAIMGGVLATGGLYSSSVTKQVTHIVALTMDHEKCKRLDEDPYMLPDPEILRKKPHDPIIETKKLDMEGATSARPTEPPRVDTRELDIFKSKKIMLNSDLKIGSHLTGTLEDLIARGGGSTTGSIHKADILICQYRESAEYRTASRAGKEVGNLTWLYYLLTHNTWTNPMRRLLHYPISQYGLPGFNKFRISLSNYNGEARVYLENLAIAAGGAFTKTMKEDNTHLITAHQYSEKCDAAREWNINMVNHLWLEDSYAKWQIQALSNPRYTHFPPRTNLSGIVGQTQIDKHAVERHFFPQGSTEECDNTEMGPLNARRLEQLDQQNSGLPGSSLLPTSSPNQIPYRTHSENDTPRASKLHKAADAALRTPAASRLVTNGKEAETPSTTSSRGAKDRAAAKLHDQAADIALYEKERKRVGGVIFGGRRKTSEDAVSNGSKKRSSPKDEGSFTDEDTRDPKRAKKSKPPPAMRMLLTGYSGWNNNKKETEDKASPSGFTGRLRNLGIMVTADPTHCTHLAAPNVLRTKKFICALAYAPMIISTDYVVDCLAKNERLEPEEYLLDDPAGEQRLDFQLSVSVSRAKNHRGRLLRGISIYCTEGIKGGWETYKDVVECNGGNFNVYKGRTGVSAVSKAAGPDEEADEMAEDKVSYVYLLSSPSLADVALWSKFRTMVAETGQHPRITDTDWLLNTALRQELHWDDKYELREDRVNDTKDGQ